LSASFRSEPKKVFVVYWAVPGWPGQYLETAELKKSALIVVVVIVLVGTALAFYFLAMRSDPPKLLTGTVGRHTIRAVVSTNGTIEPIDRIEIYAPIDGFVISIQKKEGADIHKGQLLLQLKSDQVQNALAEANASLLAAKRQARAVETGPLKEEISSLDASIAEIAMQLDQQNKDLAAEQSLYEKQATSRSAVDSLRNERDRTQLRAEGLKKKRMDLQARYSAEDKKWEQDRVAELTKQVDALRQQLLSESVLAPEGGLIYSLQVKQGSYVTKGQLLAQIYKPGKIMLRAYVDEPDLGRIRKGQPVRIEWDGLPNQHWTGLIEKTAEQVVAMNNRSVGEVLCSVENGPGGLIPNLNIRVEITTDLKQNALVVPRNAVFNHEGKPTILVLAGTETIARTVDMGLNTSEEIEILSGVKEGESVILNPTDVGTK
jgi:multidrug efflux pump subunit AcrA (membrane-fusion protein)